MQYRTHIRKRKPSYQFGGRSNNEPQPLDTSNKQVAQSAITYGTTAAGVGASIGGPVGAAIGLGVGSAYGAAIGLSNRNKARNIKAKREELLGLQQERDAESYYGELVNMGFNPQGFDDVTVRPRGGYVNHLKQNSNPQVRYLHNPAIEFPEGGEPYGQPYEIEGNEVVEGEGAALESGQRLASDFVQADGPPHSQGGVDGIGGERVFSNRLKGTSELIDILNKEGVKVGNKRQSYSKLASKIGRKKGKFEEKLGSGVSIESTTAERMIAKLDKASDAVFAEQQVRNGDIGGDENSERQFTAGGAIKKKSYQSGTRNPGDEEDSPFTPRPWDIKTGYRDGSYTPNTGNIGGTEDMARTGEEGGFKIPTAAIGQGLNLINYSLNRQDINRLETNYTPSFSRPSFIRYRDRSGPTISRIRGATRDARNSIESSSSSVKNALSANLYAKELEAINTVKQQETARRDQLEGANANISNRAKQFSDIYSNQIETMNLNRRNSRVAQQLQARNTLVAGALGQRSSDINTRLQQKQLLVELMRAGDRGTIERMAKSLGYEDVDTFIRDFLTEGQYAESLYRSR